MAFNNPMRVSELDRLMERYVTGNDIAEGDIQILRDMTNSARWTEITEVRRTAQAKPRVDALKSRFPEASTVYLKNGSPKLTVEWTRQDGLIGVVWFDGNTLHRDYLHPDALKTTAD